MNLKWLCPVTDKVAVKKRQRGSVVCRTPESAPYRSSAALQEDGLKGRGGRFCPNVNY